MIALDDAILFSVEKMRGQEITKGNALVVLKTGVRCYSDGDNKFDADA
jgi:hypothetical protein